jgi:triosephosphate isomerase (TIM)
MKPLIVANWKCNPKNLKEAKDLFNVVARGIKSVKNTDIVICPPFVYLLVLKAQNLSSVISFGGQNCFWEQSGAYTGEVSAKMLKDSGCAYVILGHSERRKYLGETGEVINKKIKTALGMGLKVIFCIGETGEERQGDSTEKVLKIQLEKGLKDLSSPERKKIIIAYEPVWAIGTGNPCSTENASGVRNFLKGAVKGIPVLYGGSVDSQNSGCYMNEAGFDGLLVGGASLKAGEFIKIVKNI